MKEKHSYQNTEVVVSKSREQIERLLRKHSAQAVRFTTFPSYALLEFIREDETGRMTPYRIRLTPKISKRIKDPEQEMNRAERQIWRVAFWWLKSKIEAIEFGLVEFEDDFLAYALLTNEDGVTGTVAEMLRPRLADLSQGGELFTGLRKALPAGG